MRELLRSALEEVDRALWELIRAEERRQEEKIILIPSESLTPKAVREALGSVFTSIYAEGYPREEDLRLPEERILDLAERLAYNRRYADRRFYKGTELVDVVEALACRRAAECFATDEVPPEEIHANVQALSGAAANMAIYDALLSPGDTIMAMALPQGGHLSHGSPFHQSGRRFRVVYYGVDPKTERLDYDRIMDLALKHKPRMIIAGYTSYPWAPDWAAFREIADRVGAYLMADIAHTAGMAIAGVYPNPIGYADVIMFTTHKTLCGPRGAVILTTDPDIAKAIDLAVFPGAQGGPHVNKFAAIAAAFALARTPEFKELQRRIVENAKYLAEALEREGLRLAYGGTDTHLLVIDLRAIRTANGETMMGEIAARILDLVGLVTNKNTIPGDTSAADAHGIRMGTPWVTERGMGKEEMEEIARIASMVLKEIRPFTYIGVTGPLSRGKLPLPVLEEARARTRELLSRFLEEPSPTSSRVTRHASPVTSFVLRGRRSVYLLHEAGTADVLSLGPGDATRTLFFDGEGRLVSEAIVSRLPDDRYGEGRYLVLAPKGDGEALRKWLSALSDGYVLFDPEDIYRKVQGPAVIEEVRDALRVTGDGKVEFTLDGKRVRVDAEGNVAPEGIFLGLSGEIKGLYKERPELFAIKKPYFVGEPLLREVLRASHPLSPPADPPITYHPSPVTKKTPLNDWHREHGANMAEFAGYDMPLWFSSALEEHRAVRERAGLFDLGHMGTIMVSGRFAEAFLDLVFSNYAAWIHPGQAMYGFLLDHEARVIDDLMIYRLAEDRYLLVVNAVNEDRDLAWLRAVNEGKVRPDPNRPWVEPPGEVELRFLKDEEGGLVDFALQGPRSRDVLTRLLPRRDSLRLRALRRMEFIELEIEGTEAICARTGYTGEPLGYEIYVPKERARVVWEAILDAGKGFGVLPCGLAARDSLRCEAGLPLWGHELAGEHEILPHEAGFGAYVKLHKPFFIGREAYKGRLSRWEREVIRFEVPAGARPVRAGAAVLDRGGRVIGWATSCVPVPQGHQVGMAIVWRRGLAKGTPIGLALGKAPERTELGARLPWIVEGKVLSRFFSKAPYGSRGSQE